MFKKVRTIVHSSGRIETTANEPQAWMHEQSVAHDKAQERRKLRDRNYILGRIASTEETMTSLVTVYATGTVVILQWIAE